MAEGFAKHLAGGRFEIYSASLVPRGLNPRAVTVMREVGIDISSQKSKPIHPTLLEPADLIVTLCGHAQEHCPVTPPHIRKTHWPIEDPARFEGTEQEIMEKFRAVRNEIEKK